MTAANAEFTALVAPHMPRLFRLGMRLTRQPSEASDLVQEALCRAWANWDRFEQGGSVGAYLARIVVNTFISRHRHARVVNAAAARSDLVEHLFDRRRMQEAHAPEGAWHSSLLSDEVHDALDALPSHYREVVELVDLQGQAYKEAAEELEIPLGTVMSRLHRARRLMRDRLVSYAHAMGYGGSPMVATAA
ncbi:MAG: sigma-70 family RNA polymerase sigma factor [Nannocystaceae bacterium]